jgi:hypothetical protein
MRPKQVGQAQKVSMLDGSLKVEAYHDNGASRGSWNDVMPEKLVSGMYTGFAPPVESIPLPLNSPRATRNQKMLLRISFVPNNQTGVSYQLGIRGLQHRITEK